MWIPNKWRVICGLMGLLCGIFVFQSHAAVTRESSVSAYDGRVIRKVEIKGLKRIEPDAVLGKIKTKKGQKLDRDTVKEDIRSIFEMGYFDGIEFQGSPAGKSVDLTIQIKERPAVAELVFDGNEKIDTDDLREVTKVKEWSILDINKVREDTELIQKHYGDKGFYLAKVDYKIEVIDSQKPDEIRVIYRINDYEKVRIKKITFLNNRVFSDTKLKGVFQETQEGNFWSFISSAGNFRESAFQTDLQRLTYWYLDNGYVKFRYEKPVVTVSPDKKWLYISIYVNEGEKYSMQNLDFSGDLEFEKSELHEELTLTKDQTFRISKRNADIQRLTEKYQDLGYAFVNVIPKMNIDDKARLVDIEYSFEKGNLVYIGEVNVVGNTKTHDKVVRRELRVYEGELYNGTRLRKSRERVERLGFFEPGGIIFNTITREGRDDIVDIEINVKERSTGTITLGAGYGSIQKFFLTTQISEINLFGRGQNISFQAQYAADRLQKSFNLGFTDPYAFDTRWSLGFDLFLVNFQIPRRYFMRKLGFDVRVGRPLTDDINAFITYKNEGLSIIRKANEEIDSSLDEGVLSSVVWSVVRDLRNNRFETSQGNYQRATLETAGLGGDKKFIKYTLNNRVYFNPFGDFVFRNSTEFGQITQAFGRPIPPAEKFYLGGPNNMKGFNIFSLGPKRTLPSGFQQNTGGNVEMFSLFEVEHPLIREAGIKWVVFFDAGNAFERFPGTGTERFTIRTDWGFGIRWFSPIGPLRFEWGFPFAKKPGEDTSVFSFFIGPPF